MRRSAVILLLIIIPSAAPVFAQKVFPSITANDRIIVIAPHPDDEVLGAGGLIQQACAVGAEVHVVYLTSGDHNQIAFKLYKFRLHLSPSQYIAFGELRHREAAAATALFGLTPDQLTFLGYPVSNLQIWRDHWGNARRSAATRRTPTRCRIRMRSVTGSRTDPRTSSPISWNYSDGFVPPRCSSRTPPTRIQTIAPRRISHVSRCWNCRPGQTPPQLYYYLVHFGQ